MNQPMKDVTIEALDIEVVLEACINAPEDTLEQAYLKARAMPAEMGSKLLFGVSEHLAGIGDHVGSTDALALSNARLPAGLSRVRRAISRRLMERGLHSHVLNKLVEDIICEPGVFDAEEQDALRRAYQIRGYQSKNVHGQGLLMEALLQRDEAELQGRTVIEIGTTRETTAGQGSTEQLAVLCAALELTFVTVDMDPFNSMRAKDMFEARNLPGEAVTSKGEDYLAAYEGQLDFVFIDAYDFDHGNHPDRRKKRYETHLGASIDELACHKMHYDCAVAVVDKLAPDGLICIDDTWQDETGAWTAKGTTAVPYLLDNGFEVLSSRSTSVLMQREVGAF